MTFLPKVVLLMATYIGINIATHVEFRKIPPKVVTEMTDHGPESDQFHIEYCGGSHFNVSINPWPLVNGRRDHRLEFNFTAAHTMKDGVAIGRMNMWPYTIKENICEFASSKYRVKFCPLVKGESYSIVVISSLQDAFLTKGHFKGNVTITDTDTGEDLLCIKFDVVFPFKQPWRLNAENYQ